MSDVTVWAIDSDAALNFENVDRVAYVNNDSYGPSPAAAISEAEHGLLVNLSKVIAVQVKG